LVELIQSSSLAKLALINSRWSPSLISCPKHL